MESSIDMPLDVANALMYALHGRKVIIKHNGLKMRGRITDMSYDGRCIRLKVDKSNEIISLYLNTYFKLLK